MHSQVFHTHTDMEPDPAHVSLRVQSLERFTRTMQGVFGLGDALHAVTLTANGNAVRGAERQGVVLECMCHRAVWLAGQ